MATVLLVDPALAGLVARFRERLPTDVTVDAVRDFTVDDLRARAADAIAFVDARRPIGPVEMAAAPGLRLIQMIGAGYDPVERPAADASGVLVAYNPGVNASGAAEHTIMLMLALLKQLPASDAATRAGRFDPGEIIGRGIGDLADATIGLVGMGHIGQAVADRLAPFGSRVLYHARRALPDVDARTGARHVPFDELLRASTLVSLHVPLTPETHHLIGSDELAAMPRGGYLVNAGRGGLVDEKALREAVVGGHLAGAALDVLERETDGENPFADVPGVIVTPHLGGGSRNSMAGVVERCTANIRRLLAGEPIRDLVPG